MSIHGLRAVATALCCAVTLGAGLAHAEVVEEIVAWINGDIITKSDLESEEQLLVADAYRRYTGDELDRAVGEIRKGLLAQMINNKILVDRAAMLYDVNKMREGLYEDFKAQQRVEDDAEFERMLAAEGMTVEGVKDRLVDMYAPQQVLAFEVGGRVAVGPAEVEAYYNEHPDEFNVPGEVTIREIVLLADSPSAKEARRAEAERLVEQVRGGADFAELARDHSEAGTAQSGGELGPLKKGDLARQLEQVAFELPVGEISDPLDTAYGWHIIKVDSRTDDRTLSLDEVRNELQVALEQKKLFEEREEYMKKARENAEWCVNPRYREWLPIDSPPCESL